MTLTSKTKAKRGTKRKRSQIEDAPTPRRSVRRKRKPFDDAIKAIPTYFIRPRYEGRQRSQAGGKHSSAACSPRAYEKNTNSKANSRLPRDITDARHKYDHVQSRNKANFKAGHLLNEQFGGSGSNARNLTILTNSANGRHKTFDEPLKKAFDALMSAYRAVHQGQAPESEGGHALELTDYRFGIQIDVKTSRGVWGSSPPDSSIVNSLACEARLICQLRKNAGYDDATFQEVCGTFAPEDECESRQARNAPDDCRAALVRARDLIAKANRDGGTILNSKPRARTSRGGRRRGIGRRRRR